MSARLNFVNRSYVKTTVASVVLFLLTLLYTFFGLYWLPNILGPVVAALGVLLAIGAATIASAGTVAIVRYTRGLLGERDLLLELNRSRESAAIRAAAATRSTRVRRWLAQRMLGHELVVGDLVEIKMR